MPISPLQVQRPRPPIIVVGASEKRTVPLISRCADIWNPPAQALGHMERKVGAGGATLG